MALLLYVVAFILLVLAGIPRLALGFLGWIGLACWLFAWQILPHITA